MKKEQELVLKRDRLIEELKKVRAELKQIRVELWTSKYPLPKDGQKIVVVYKNGKYGIRGIYYRVGSPLLKHPTIDWNGPCRHTKHHIVVKQKRDRPPTKYFGGYKKGDLICYGFKSNWHIKNGGWKPMGGFKSR